MNRVRPLAGGAGLKALPPSANMTSSSMAKAASLLKPNSTEVVEARYIRDQTGKKSACYRSGLDEEIELHDLEVAAMADHRQASAFHFACKGRDQASRWREKALRDIGLREVQWKLDTGEVEIAKKPHDDVDRRAARDLDDMHMLVAPRTSPVERAKHARDSVVSSVQRKKKKKRSDRIDDEFGESSSGSGSDDELYPEEDPEFSGRMGASMSLKQPLRVRLRRLKQNAREWRQAMIKEEEEAQLAKTAARQARQENKAEAQGKKKKKKGKRNAGNSSDDELDSLDDLEERSAPPTPTTARKTKIEHRASHVAAFLNQSEQDQQMLRRIFEQYDVNGSDSLDQSELVVCLCDMGLRGKNETERSEIRKILWSIDELEVGFYQFATEVVPNIRKRLGELQQENLAKLFAEADADGSGLLSLEEALKELRLMGCFPGEDLVKEAIVEAAPEAAEMSRSMDGSWLKTRDILDVRGFGTLIRILQEKTARQRAERTRELRAEYKLTEADIQAWGHTLVDVHHAFTRVGSQPISKTRAAIAVRECGLAPRNMTQRYLIKSVVDEEADADSSIDFPHFLKIGQKLREHDRQWLHRVFDKNDRQRDNALDLAEVHGALSECGIRPRTQRESEEIRNLIEEFDEDCSGDVDREEFINLYRFVSERLHKVQREVERQCAIRFAWDDEQFEELRATFLAFDTDASEALDLNEMMQAVETLQKSFSREDLNPVLQEAGLPQHNKNIKVDFLAFMKIMKSLEDRESIRQIGRKYGFDADGVSKLRVAFNNLGPDQEGCVARDCIRPLMMVDADANHARDLCRELESTQPARVDFEVLARFMKKKADGPQLS